MSFRIRMPSRSRSSCPDSRLSNRTGARPSMSVRTYHNAGTGTRCAASITLAGRRRSNCRRATRSRTQGAVSPTTPEGVDSASSTQNATRVRTMSEAVHFVKWILWAHDGRGWRTRSGSPCTPVSTEATAAPPQRRLPVRRRVPCACLASALAAATGAVSETSSLSPLAPPRTTCVPPGLSPAR